MKSTVACIIMSILLLAAAAVLALPLVRGAHSIPAVKAERARLDSEEVRAAALADTLQALTAIDSLTLQNLQEINKLSQ